LRSFHLQAPIIWIGLGWIASGLFIAPAIAGGREAKGQGFLVDLLFWVSLFVVAAALLGNYLGIQGVIDKGWFWFGNQGLSYIQLGRFWQILFFVALLSWSGLMFRALWPTRDTLVEATRQFWTGKIRLEHLIWAATPPLLPDRMAAARRGVRAWFCVGAQPGILRPISVLAVDAHARRHCVLSGRAADGLGFHHEAPTVAWEHTGRARPGCRRRCRVRC